MQHPSHHDLEEFPQSSGAQRLYNYTRHGLLLPSDFHPGPGYPLLMA
jgi:hypothetical protein